MKNNYRQKIRTLGHIDHSKVGKKEIFFDFNHGDITITDSGGFFGKSLTYTYHINECTLYIMEGVMSMYGAEHKGGWKAGKYINFYDFCLITPDFPKIKPDWQIMSHDDPNKEDVADLIKKINNHHTQSDLKFSNVCYTVEFWNEEKSQSFDNDVWIRITQKSIIFKKATINGKPISEEGWFGFTEKEDYSDGSKTSTKNDEFFINFDQISSYNLVDDKHNDERSVQILFLKGDFNNIQPGCKVISIPVGTEPWIIDKIMKHIKNTSIQEFSPIEFRNKWDVAEANKKKEEERLSKICKHCGGELAIDHDYQDKTKALANTAKVIVKGATLLAGGGVNSPFQVSQGTQRLKCEDCGQTT